jgi:uncharacterized protein (TIGR02996 family)
MSKRPNKRSDAAFLDAIYANPDDFALRAVYGDVLQERGDPRGEFIALQLANHAGQSTAASLRRERELIAANFEAWVGPLAAWFTTYTPIHARFEGGFFVGGRLERFDRQEAMVAEPAWRLVHHLQAEAPWLPDPALLGRLRSLHGVGELAEIRVPWSIESRAPTGARYAGELIGPTPLIPQIAKVWACFVDDLGQTFDTYSVNDRGAPALGKSPVETLVKRASGAGVRELALGRTGHAETVHLEPREGGHAMQFTIVTSRAPAEVIAWFTRMIALASGGRARMHASDAQHVDPTFSLGPYGTPEPGWVIAFAPTFTSWLPVEALAAAGVRVVPAGDQLVVVVAERPADATWARMRDVAAAVVAILDAEVDRRCKLDFADRAVAAFAWWGKPRRATPTRVEIGELTIELRDVIDDRPRVVVLDGVRGSRETEQMPFTGKAELGKALTRLARIARERYEAG